jgi:hypothetical protein
VKVLFTCSNNPLSYLICKLTREPVSHCAIQVGDHVLHSTLQGLKLEHISTFTKHRKIVCSVKLRVDLGEEAAHPRSGTYDYLGLLYLGLRYFARDYLGIRLPKYNLWQITGMYTCVELVSKELTGEEYSMMTPYQLYLYLGGTPL